MNHHHGEDPLDRLRRQVRLTKERARAAGVHVPDIEPSEETKRAMANDPYTKALLVQLKRELEARGPQPAN